jgi:DNA-binding MarR family transcriptional regulator
MADLETITPKLFRLAAVLTHRSDDLLQNKLGIGFSQYKILWALRRHERVQQNFIAMMLNQTEASVSRQIRMMTEAGLLKSLMDPEDRRSNYVVLTPKGNRLAEAGMRELDNAYGSAFARLDKAETENLDSLLGRLSDAICGPNGELWEN